MFDAKEAVPISVIQLREINPFGAVLERAGLESFSPDGKLLAVTGSRRNPPRDEPEFGLEVFDVVGQERPGRCWGYLRAALHGRRQADSSWGEG